MTPRTKRLSYLPTDEDIAAITAAPTSIDTRLQAMDQYRRMLAMHAENVHVWRHPQHRDKVNWLKVGRQGFAIYMELRDLNPAGASALAERLGLNVSR